ncbi:globin domain-containing protein [Streptomyces sp. NPDC012751]|uniref:globin domain-containing protein n=1 Tax=Streptomyces sp. NPDC012751 TaxID=3364846 RepID=UPI0036A7259A
MSANDRSYHTLLARHEAMRLRRRLLTPGSTAGAEGQPPAGEPYDGGADQRTIMDHLDLVAPFEELITHLYQALFTRYPSLRSLFPASMEFQKAHLARAFSYMIEHLDRPDDITRTFTQLGRDHRKLGLLPAQYAAFEAALCTALRTQAGERWHAELERAWVRMLRLGVTAMVRGADAALHEPLCWRATVTAHQLRGPSLAVLRLRPHETFRHRAGQYVTLESARLPHTWRPYYPAGAPGQEELEFHVRRTGPGGVSDALVRHTSIGDEVRIGPPKGNLTLGDEALGELRLVAWDTGWAAMKALLRELDARMGAGSEHRGCAVRLLMGAGTLSDLYDTDYLTAFASGRPWLTVVPLIAGAAPEERTRDRLVQAVAECLSPVAGPTLVAGPPTAVSAVTDALVRAGLPAEHLRHDLPSAGARDVRGNAAGAGPAGRAAPPGQPVRVPSAVALRAGPAPLPM